ncbi:uncharacterized protein Z518_02632 [Rhinocladiella mackenziei CBS 650.93]|uniref:Uncharacterized protein n=1 Tax=Rhinocladiella mackenziei CBS 650.93 TaxID=1442369 RepID=A0A0D2HC13_9EURO|nr:uncharacterized protein Z518_02632 [Rhinocladiella mackenziei CBS 650.93]KIX07978.1 hypothetical protein Z518_02632 [Rhinocladiella mackenziei CBS 650.93]
MLTNLLEIAPGCLFITKTVQTSDRSGDKISLAVAVNLVDASATGPTTEVPRHLGWRRDVTTYLGSLTYVTSLDSLCGYVTEDVHRPLYCSAGQYCSTQDSYLLCCATTTERISSDTYFYTITIQDRDADPTYSTSTAVQTLSLTVGADCTTASTTCYNYDNTDSCTDSTCTASALMCTDQYFPSCASLYSMKYNYTILGTSSMISNSVQKGLSYFCDTAAFGLSYTYFAYGAVITSTLTSTKSTETDTDGGETFTPTPTPFSLTQASRPAAASGATTSTAPTSTSTSAGNSLTLGKSSLSVLKVWCLSLSLPGIVWLIS